MLLRPAVPTATSQLPYMHVHIADLVSTLSYLLESLPAVELSSTIGSSQLRSHHNAHGACASGSVLPAAFVRTQL
jgi:hypothetical protein